MQDVLNEIIRPGGSRLLEEAKNERD